MNEAADIDLPGGSPGPWYRVEAINAAYAGGTADRDYATVLPAVLDAARRRRPIIAGWLGRGGSAPLDLITNSGSVPEADDDAALPRPYFPWGARGTLIGGNLIADLGRLVWTVCPIRPAPPLPAGQPEPSAKTPALFESALQTLLGREFAWLVIAEPTDRLADEETDLRTQLAVPRRYEEERSRFDAERAQARLNELNAYREAGLWSVRLLVGASTERELSVIAPVLTGAACLTGHHYGVRSADGAHDFADALVATLSDQADDSAVPCLVTAGMLAALVGLPRRDVPGVRVLEPGHVDLTPEFGTRESPAARVIEVGAILDRYDRAGGRLGVPLETLSRHTFVAGAAGSGKSHTVRHLLDRLTDAGITWLVIEPARAEYAAMAATLDGRAEVTVINPVGPDAAPLSVNPLRPEPGYPVRAHIDLVRALFVGAFADREPFPRIISQALPRAYAECGWDLETGDAAAGGHIPPMPPTLEQLQSAALRVIDGLGYGRELRADVRGLVDVRLRSLRTGLAGRFLQSGHPADIAGLMSRNTVLELADAADDEDKAFLIGTLILRIVEHLRLRARTVGPEQPGGLRHVIVIEEAHRLLRDGRDGAAAQAVELFASLLAEIRGYGVGLLIAEQIPAKLVSDVVKNSALKIMHRLPAADDRQLVGATMNLDNGLSRQVVSLTPGTAAVFADGMDRPVLIRVPPVTAAKPGPPGPEPPLAGRRSPACGAACRQRPCTLREMRAADLLASATEDAWLRVWVHALVLALLTNRALPRVPGPLRERWADLDARLRDCALATVVDGVIGARTAALRSSYHPERLSRAASEHACSMLTGGKGAGLAVGPQWVIPQVRWLHEFERVCPLDEQAPDPFAPAPRLDYALPGLADWDGVKIGQRVTGLRRHSLSMVLDRNRLPAWTALLGDDDQSGFISDLASVATGVSHHGQLRKAAGEMGISGWLEPVLSWPRRFIVGAADEPHLAESVGG